ncbi:MAG: PAS domain-containing protein [bacterium]|nr:PAS domain-containing protein [bacterium]
MSDAALIDHMDVPILIGDPEANAVHMNPAFERSFGVDAGLSLGTPLAELFEGGGREAMLRAVASACGQGASVRCRIRERGVGWCAVISPIANQGEQVGVVVLLTEEQAGADQLMSLRRELEAPVDEVELGLETLLEETGGRRNPGHRARLEETLRSVERLRKSLDEMSTVLAGRQPAARVEPFDPAQVVRQVADATRERFAERETSLQLLAPTSLAGFPGDGPGLERALRALVDARLACREVPARITLGVRRLGPEDAESLVVSVSETPRDGPFESTFPDDPALMDRLNALGARVHAYVHPRLGRTTILQMHPAS